MASLSIRAKSDLLARGESRGAVACAHCGLPVPAGLVEPEVSLQFCCGGCRVVHDAIRSCGLDDFYVLRDASDDAARPARTTSRRYEELDDPVFAERHCRRTGDGLRAVELYLDGVHCAACVWLVERLPALVPGVVETRLNLGRRIVRIVWDDSAVPLSRIARRLASFGYPAHALSGRDAHERRRLEDRKHLIRLAVAGALAGNVMIISFALYGGLFHGIEPQYFHLFRGVSLALTALSLAWPGAVFFRGAFAAVRARAANMDVPIAVGLAVGGVWSAIATLRGTGDVYFDSVTVLVFLLLAGRWVHLRQQRRGHDSVEMLFSMTPRFARLVEDGVVREVAAESVAASQLLEVRAGDTVPADGVVQEGVSDVDRSWLSGESRPVAVAPGDRVHAGTTNLRSRLLVRVEAAGEDTRAGRLMRLVEDMAHRRAPIVRLADRIAGVFVVVVLVLAAATVALWWRTDPAWAIANGMALLVVTCPCALGLATPLAIVAAIGRAARRGILVKGGDVIERLTTPGVVYLDKTGTITEGRTCVAEWNGPDDLEPVVAALETRSAHPVARAFVDAFADSRAGPRPEVTSSRSGASGIEGVVDGRCVTIGSRAYVAARGIDVPDALDAIGDGLTKRALSPVFVAVDGEARAIAGVGDAVGAGAAGAIAQLTRLGWRVGILSGDHPEVVAAVAAEVGVDPARCHGGVTPEEKLRLVERAVRAGPVVMVGDGINDAAALAAATVGVAVRGGAEISLATADVYLSESGLTRLPELLVGVSRTLHVIRRNLLVSLLYNVVGAGLAIAGVISPLLAAILMPLSSLTVITMSFRSRTFGGPTGEPPCR